MSASFEEDKVFTYLDELRDSGVTNMWGAGPYVEQEFGVSRRVSHVLLDAWMRSKREGASE